MAVIVGRMLALLEAQTAQFDARMAAAGQQFNRMTSTATSAARGVALLRGGMQQLAFQAAGASGPIGRVAGGLLTIGFGGGVALGAAAGIGAVTLAVHLLTAGARENKIAQDALIQSLDKLGTHGHAVATRLRIAQLEQLRDAPNLGERLKGLGSEFLGDMTADLIGASRTKQVERINREIARLQGDLGRAGEAFEAPWRRMQGEAGLGFRQAQLRREGQRLPTVQTAIDEQVRIAALEYQKVPPAIAREIAARERLTSELDAGTTALAKARLLGEEAALRARMVGAPALAITEALRRSELLQQGVAGAEAVRIAQAERRAAASMQTTDILRTMGPQLAVQSLLAAQQGGVGGFGQTFFPGAAGMAAALPGVGPFAGAGIMALGGLLGGVFGDMETGAERRHRELKQVLEKLATEVGLERVTVVFTGPDGHQIRKTLAELEDSDAVSRIPGPVGATG